jgi:hypothetical protein
VTKCFPPIRNTRPEGSECNALFYKSDVRKLPPPEAR